MLRVTENNRKWWVLGAMTGSLSMILLDQTVVSVALPSIQRVKKNRKVRVDSGASMPPIEKKPPERKAAFRAWTPAVFR
jgi:hypothetical protein